MELDRELLKKIQLLDDSALRDAIENVARNMGIDPDSVNPYLQDMWQIKKTVSGLTQGDLDRIGLYIGEENTRRLMDQIREEMNKE